MTGQTIKSLCNVCGGETEHFVDWQHARRVMAIDDGYSETRVYSVRCLGCQDLSARTEFWYSDGDGIEHLHDVEFQPPRLWRRAPSWLDALNTVAPDLKGLLDEVYSITTDKHFRLLSMGVRATLDHMMSLILGGDLGTFDEKLTAMVKAGHLSDRQREHIAIVIDAGSASSHRGFRPQRDLIEEMVVVMESLVRTHYITGPMLQMAKTQIPPRPPRRVGKAIGETVEMNMAFDAEVIKGGSGSVGPTEA